MNICDVVESCSLPKEVEGYIYLGDISMAIAMRGLGVLSQSEYDSLCRMGYETKEQILDYYATLLEKLRFNPIVYHYFYEQKKAA